MTKSNKIAAAAGAAIIIAVLAIWLLSMGGHKSTPQNDAKSDCWAHADKAGSRHCPTVKA